MDRYAEAKAAIAAIDLTAENERLAELKTKIEEAYAAQNEGRRRIAALNGDQQATDRLQASRVADVLLQGADGRAIDTLVRSSEASSAEKETLLRAMHELSRRISEMEIEKLTVEAAARKKVAHGTRLLADIILAEARDQAEALLRSYASLKVLSRWADHYPSETGSAHNAVKAFFQDHGLAANRRKLLEVPATVLDALAPLTDLGPAIPASKYGIVGTVDW